MCVCIQECRDTCVCYDDTIRTQKRKKLLIMHFAKIILGYATWSSDAKF